MRNLSLLGVSALLMTACSQTASSTISGAPAQGHRVQVAAFSDWPALRDGDSGRDVVTVQYLLRELGYSVSVDGAYGTETYNAVSAFQSAKALRQDGVVGNNTWEALLQTVRLGDNNSAVRAAQDQLRNQYGYGITVDGDFGSNTDAAVRGFQRSRHINDDGIVGRDTWHALVTGSAASGGTAAQLAQQILNDARITLETSSSTPGGSPRQNIIDTVNGLGAVRGCSAAAGGATCGGVTKRVSLQPEMLRALLNLAKAGNSMRVTSIAGGQHGSERSDHYNGTAFDLGTWNGTWLGSPNSAHTASRNACLNQGADSGQTFNAYYDPYGGHSNHVHCSF